MEDSPYDPAKAGTADLNPAKPSLLRIYFKRTLQVLGAAFLLLICLVVWIAFVTNQTYKSFNGGAEPFIEGFLTEQQPWDYQVAKPHLSTLWIDNVTEEKSTEIFTYYNKLGKLGNIESVTAQQCLKTSELSSGTVNRCNFVAKVSYENGDAEILVGMRMEQDTPKIIQLYVNSDVFLQ